MTEVKCHETSDINANAFSFFFQNDVRRVQIRRLLSTAECLQMCAT